jgi:hypothetical protein
MPIPDSATVPTRPSSRWTFLTEVAQLRINTTFIDIEMGRRSGFTAATASDAAQGLLGAGRLVHSPGSRLSRRYGAHSGGSSLSAWGPTVCPNAKIGV